MSDISASLEDVDLLLNGGVTLNKLNYIRKQAISADVLFTLAIRNRLLIRCIVGIVSKETGAASVGN